MTRLFSLFVFLHTLLTACSAPRAERGAATDATDRYELLPLGRLERHEVRESSGLAPANAEATELWTHGDYGRPNALYRIDKTGRLLQTLPVPGADNHDWEDLAPDPQGRLYIADCGNNDNRRRNLAIYRFDPAHPARPADTIRFRYPDQREFPPRKADRNFDCEAACFRADSLLLFTKNRGKGSLITKQYAVAARPGTHVATLVDSLELETWVTGAAISPDGRTVALLGYGYVYFFEGSPNQRVFDRARSWVKVGTSGQAEAITFVNDHDVVFSNEKGKLFSLRKRR